MISIFDGKYTLKNGYCQLLGSTIAFFLVVKPIIPSILIFKKLGGTKISSNKLKLLTFSHMTSHKS